MNEGLINRLRENDPSLEHIWIDDGGETDLHQFCAAVQVNSNIKDFHFQARPNRITIDVNTADALSNAITRMPTVEGFCLRSCGFEDSEVVRRIVSRLANTDTLLDLEFEGCNIGDAEMEVIASSFWGNNSLIELDLTSNRIGDAGAISIASLIVQNKSLKELYLNRNLFRSEGAIAIAQAIPRNKSITNLSVAAEGEIFPDEVKIAYETALYNDESIETVTSSNHTLTYLAPYEFLSNWLSSTQTSEHGPDIARKAKINRFLEEKPKCLLSTCRDFDESLMAAVFENIGRRPRCLGTMFELVRNAPDLLNNPRKRPYRQCRKLPRPVYTF